MESNFQGSLFVKKLNFDQFRFKTPENLRKTREKRRNFEGSGSRDTCRRKFELLHTDPDDLVNYSFQKDFPSLEKSLKPKHLSQNSRNIPKVDLIFSFKVKKIQRLRKKSLKSPRQGLDTSQGPRFRLPSRETSYDHNLYQSFFQSPNKIVETLQSSQQYSKGLQKGLQQKTVVISYPKKVS
jgi:hypothetical protein